MHASPSPAESRQAATIHLHVIREPAYVPMSPRKQEICWNFGVPPREPPFVVADDLSVRLAPGAIILLTGPSGSGKSSVLRGIAQRAGQVVWVGEGRFLPGRAIVESVAPRATLAQALEILTACGLGEPRLWVRQFGDLSDGERFRVCLARAIGASFGVAGAQPIFCDEFTAILHRRMAKAVAYNLRKLVARHKLALVVATTHDDIIEDLQPDQIIRLGGPQLQVTSHEVRDRPMSLRRQAAIEEGAVRDYRLFSPMHYRNRDGLGFVDKVFLLRESPHGDPLGILVFAHAPMELTLRNRSTDGRFIRNIRRLNRELRILRRLVMHPDVRGCGLGHWFVANTLPRVGVRFVECLAAMGAINPVFERAGMRCVGRCPLPRGRLALLDRMRQLRLDPFAADFAAKIGRCPRVRKLVEQTIQDWVRATQGAAQYRVAGRPPKELAQVFRQLVGRPPLYYLWDREGVYPRTDEAADSPVRSRPDTNRRADRRNDNEPSGQSQSDRHDPRSAAGTHRPGGVAD